ncbi:acetyl-CoA carboxylase, carboxyltransferase subunit beta [Clostridium sp. UBA4548]|uniref:acetyl-CoA carboxylase, carboxyltransferase subunit beta n=1 Tax=Clostridium sp. UBA4548 TaxID=1946361 RepID=UPI0025B7B82B|nr:acetyl-CoA carboxylase, carboxyltransferase subunit beta [Clostridium sp. UBA4548]
MLELKRLFKKNVYIEVKNNPQGEENKPTIPDGLWVKCEGCGKILYKNDLEENQKVCNLCNYHFRLTARERIEQIIDSGTFIELNKELISSNPLDFNGYEEKLEKLKKSTELEEAVVTGYGKINNNNTVIAVMDSRFLMGSMGSVVGEKITRAVEFATEKELPIVIFTCSGGARMQEGIFSLMQMAKTSSAISIHNKKGLLYITVITDPTTGGVTASFAMLGDIILSEPNALIGFAGRRVIEQTIKESLPADFQKAEFLQKKGFVDRIVKRNELKETLGKLLRLHRS